jgi:transcription elongation factor Elf1
MERLIFVCPTTRSPVDVGIESEIGTLLRIRSKVVTARCKSCGSWHEWRIRDAWLAAAA